MYNTKTKQIISSLPTIDVMVQFNDMVEILFASGVHFNET